MVQPGVRIPAWKRLGLKLKDAGQSAEPASSGHQVDQLHHVQPSVEPDSTWEKTHGSTQITPDRTQLGKRKHQADAAEAEGESVKKTKHFLGHSDPDGHAVAALQGANGSIESAPSKVPPSDQSQPKGDPNYRKKKGDPNYRNKKGSKKDRNGRKAPHASSAQETGQVPPVPSQATLSSARTPSLSPGEADSGSNRATLLVSAETDIPSSPSFATPQKLVKESSSITPSLSPPKTDRRKSVTFTPDTKTKDGNSASSLFKKWVAEQKGPSVDFSSAEVAQFAAPPKVHIANSNPSSNNTDSVDKTPPKGKKKDPSRYLNYLTQYHKDRADWKFNKAIQNDVLENSLNIFRIPEEHSEALLEYVRGLKGAGVIDRLRERCTNVITEIDQAGENEDDTMDAPEERQAIQDAALQERLAKERKRRRVEGDVENMLGHPYTEGYIRRLKRHRAEALLTALKLAAPVSTPQTGLGGAKKNGSSESAKSLLSQSNPRVHKSRTDISSDESSDSSDSSSEDSPSSEEDSSGNSSDSRTSSDSSDSEESGDESSSSDSESD